MTRTLALIISIAAWAVGAWFISQGAIRRNLEHTYWMRGSLSAEQAQGVTLRTEEQDTTAGIEQGVGLATVLGVLLWLALSSLIPWDQRRVIGKAVIEEAVQRVDDQVPLSQAQRTNAFGRFWRRFERLFG
jgi:hypothetical protein